MHLKIIDYLKGYSIFTIAVFHLLLEFHLPKIFSHAINFGGAGVHVFIFCSGFGLCMSQLNKPLNYIGFLRRRFLKTHIPYIIVIAISASIPFVYMGGDKCLAVLSHVFLFKMFNERFNISFGVPFYFMSAIIQFYLIFPILFKIVKTYKHVYVIICSLLISMMWASVVSYAGKADLRVWACFFLQYLWEFVLGMILALKYSETRHLKIPRRRYLILSALFGISMLGFMGVKGGIYKLYNDIPALIGYMSLALLLYSFGIKRVNDFFAYTGKISYEWYLLHVLVFICVFHYVNLTASPVLVGGLALMLSYGAAILYHNLMKFGKFNPIVKI